jgi:hypothetical protein
MTATSNDPDNDPAFIPALRWMSNMACLWSFCRNPACSRARQCKRDPRFCLRRYAPLLPDEVRDGIKLMLEGQRSGKSYDDLAEEAPDLIAAVEDWIARVDASTQSGAPVAGNGG